jgi:hypothetical protein
VKLPALFLRQGCKLPDRFVLEQEQYCQGWMSVEGISAVAFGDRVRGAGWHFMWIVGSYSRRGFGRTREKAIRCALERALKIAVKRFNSSELDSFHVKRFSGFHIAKVTMQPRQIQQHASLG